MDSNLVKRTNTAMKLAKMLIDNYYKKEALSILSQTESTIKNHKSQDPNTEEYWKNMLEKIQELKKQADALSDTVGRVLGRVSDSDDSS